MKAVLRFLIRWPLVGLFAVVGSIGMLFGLLWHQVTGKKAAVLQDELYVGGKRIRHEDIEQLFFFVYFMGCSVKLKLRNRRRLHLRPIPGTNLLAWAKKSGVSYSVGGDPAAIPGFERRMEYAATLGL